MYIIAVLIPTAQASFTPDASLADRSGDVPPTCASLADRIGPPIEELPGDAWARITRAVDGDTVTIEYPDRVVETVRLAGIDAPERTQDYGTEARAVVAEYVGATVVIEGRGRDRHRRTVARVCMASGVDLGRMLITQGAAWAYPSKSHPQPEAEALEYLQAEQEARHEGRGLWRVGEPLAPWDYRRQRRGGKGSLCFSGGTRRAPIGSMRWCS